jgi:lycopene cyclase domain-containing protein
VTGLGYTVPAVGAVLAVCAAEVLVLRTGLFRRLAYWLTMVIVLAFQIPVDGWLTKLSAPVVEYAPRQVTGLRGPWDIPVEDFLYGFAMVTAALLLWERQGVRRKGAGHDGYRGNRPAGRGGPEGSGAEPGGTERGSSGHDRAGRPRAVPGRAAGPGAGRV